MVARELRSGRLLRLWRDELQALRRPPFAVGAETLVRGLLRLAPSSAASWPSAGRCRRASSTCSPSSGPRPTACRRPCGAGLLGALAVARARRHGRRREGRDARPRPARRAVVARRSAGRILDYCQADVDALAALLPRMLPGILGRQRDAAHRARPGAAARPLHGRRGPHGVDRRPDRHRHAGAPPGRLGRASRRG